MSDPNNLANMFMAYALQMQQTLEQQQQAALAVPQGANVLLQDLTFHPPGVEKPLLSGVNMHLAANQLGLVIGRSGSGKTTLLQLLAGLTDQTSGAVYISQQQLVQMVAGAGAPASSNGGGSDGGGVGFAPLPTLPPALTLEQRMGKVSVRVGRVWQGHGAVGR
jgi:energy-coupling factor transporter ATP-binding protein EcfA2